MTAARLVRAVILEMKQVLPDKVAVLDKMGQLFDDLYSARCDPVYRRL